MSDFDPLGHFRAVLDAPLNVAVIARAQSFVHLLPEVPVGDLTRLYLHWTVAGCDTRFPDYNCMALESAPGEWEMAMTHDVRDNALSTFKPYPGYAAHTYHRNEGAVGIALAGMEGATEHNFGVDPATVAGLVCLCAMGGAVALKYGIDATGVSDGGFTGAFGGEPTILTHCEAANRPGNPSQYPDGPYGPEPVGDGERWDFGSLVALPEGVDLIDAMAAECGDALRLMVHRYKGAIAA